MRIGSENASMPTKCMDQMPAPMAKAPPSSHRRAARPWLWLTRLAMSSAV
jgi:hypothetical protein